LPPFSGHEIKGKEKNQEKKDADRPEQPPPNRVALLLGIEKNPKGDPHADYQKEKSHGPFLLLTHLPADTESLFPGTSKDISGQQ
jgi:hypothetical protein